MAFEVSQLFMEAFGLKVDQAYAPEFGDNKANFPQLDFNGITIVDEEEAVELSSLGTPVIYPITLLGGKYKHYTNDGQVEYRSKSEFRLPLTCIVDFDRQKIMRRTRINNGAGGTVKETFGFDDWKVTIRGLCVADQGQKQSLVTAMDQEEELMAWEQIVDSIGIRGKLFNVRDITNIIITKIPMNTLRGKPNIRPFTIHACSDEPLELVLQ